MGRIFIEPKEGEMTKRMNKRQVVFQHPFLLDETEEEFPAGAYVVETEEESLDGISFRAFRRIATTLIRHPPMGTFKPTKYWMVDPKGLDTALEIDSKHNAPDISFDTPKSEAPND